MGEPERVSDASRAAVLACGERLSSRIGRRLLAEAGTRAHWVDARELLERAARGELETSDVLVNVARETVEDCRCAWDEATLAALRSLAARPDPCGP